MPRKYGHLSAKERDELAHWRTVGKSIRWIARKLGRNPSTLSRELRRNGTPLRPRRYRPHKAQARYEARNRKRAMRPRMKSERIRHYARSLLTKGWSPEQISGIMVKECHGEKVCYETIYKWIYAVARHLIPFLPRGHQVRHPRRWTMRSRKTRIPGRIHVSMRPKVANERRRFGDWEVDTVGRRLGAPALQLAVERKTRYVVVNWLKIRTARNMDMALSRSLIRFPKGMRRTITYDNGGENANHLLTNAKLGTKSFFCTPYTAQERGTVENTGGLIRRIFPKKTDFSTVTRREVKKAQALLNHRPRKILGYRTPAEAFQTGVALTG